jgi:hypothetical protein
MSKARYKTADARQTTFALCKERRRRQLPARRAREAPKKLEGAADLQEEMAEQRFSVPSDPTKTAATQRASPRAERIRLRASVNRAPPHGGGGSRGVLPLRETTTAADPPRDCASNHKSWRVPAIPLRQAGPR